LKSQENSIYGTRPESRPPSHLGKEGVMNINSAEQSVIGKPPGGWEKTVQLNLDEARRKSTLSEMIDEMPIPVQEKEDLKARVFNLPNGPKRRQILRILRQIIDGKIDINQPNFLSLLEVNLTA
jgi:hypothetical protein